MKKGTVRWFNDAKGYGFIDSEEGQDIFVHFSVIEKEGFKTLEQGQKVEFDLKETDKGLQAQDVKAIETVNM